MSELSVKSWRGTYSKFDCGKEIKKLEDFVIETFHLPMNYDFDYCPGDYKPKKKRHRKKYKLNEFLLKAPIIDNNNKFEDPLVD